MLRNVCSFYSRGLCSLIETRLTGQNTKDKEQTRKALQHTLKTIFSSFENTIRISKTFRIFLSYFNQDRVDKMLQSEYIEQYLQYLCAKQQAEPISRPELKQLLLQIGMTKSIQHRMLQVYINYVKRTVDLTENTKLMSLFDVRTPENWYLAKEMRQRRFIYHHGPTNSGKTFSAINELKGLKQSEKGIYMAPLRLLAWQGQKKLGKCNLVTGQEKDYQNSNITSCTVEAANLNQQYEVAVLDEIQMVGDRERGSAWTSVLLGVKANRIHLCGDERALHLVSRLIAISGGVLEQRKYTRLSKLVLLNKKFNMKDLMPGDCLIDFSAKRLYSILGQINKAKGTSDKPCQTAIIYGKMPPNCRKAQAQKFNKGELPYLVASDAIGMGLNLNIRRVVFVNLHKMTADGTQRELYDFEIRQIAGRAGRGYGKGYVQCSDSFIYQKIKHALKRVNVTFDESDQPTESSEQTKLTSYQILTADDTNYQNYDCFLKRSLQSNEMQIKRASLFFPQFFLERVKIRLERLLKRNLQLSELISLSNDLANQNQELFFIEQDTQMVKLSKRIQKYNFSMDFLYRFSRVPTNKFSYFAENEILKFAEDFKLKGRVQIPNYLINSHRQDYRAQIKNKDINSLMDQFAVLDMYSWLWGSFQLYFPEHSMVEQMKSRICLAILQILQTSPQISMKSKQGHHRHSGKSNDVSGPRMREKKRVF